MAGCKVTGLYGGAGSGKSEAARYLKERYGAYIIKADELGHRLYKKGQPGYKAIIRLCGREVLDNNRNIDYKKLAEVLFCNPELLHEVNASIHPMVYAKAQDMIRSYKSSHKRGLIFFEAALLPEKKLEFIEENWYIRSDAASRSKRMSDTRNYSESKISALMRSQPSDEEYRNHCGRIIENTKTIKELEENIDEAIKHSQRKQR